MINFAEQSKDNTLTVDIDMAAHKIPVINEDEELIVLSDSFKLEDSKLFVENFSHI